MCSENVACRALGLGYRGFRIIGLGHSGFRVFEFRVLRVLGLGLGTMRLTVTWQP